MKECRASGCDRAVDDEYWDYCKYHVEDNSCADCGEQFDDLSCGQDGDICNDCHDKAEASENDGST